MWRLNSPPSYRKAARLPAKYLSREKCWKKWLDIRTCVSKHWLTPQEEDGFCSRPRANTRSSGTSGGQSSIASRCICWPGRTLLFVTQAPTASCFRLFRIGPQVLHTHLTVSLYLVILGKCCVCLLDTNSHWGKSRAEGGPTVQRLSSVGWQAQWLQPPHFHRKWVRQDCPPCHLYTHSTVWGHTTRGGGIFLW